MPTFEITDNATGAVFEITGDREPTEQEIRNLLAGMDGQPQQVQQPPQIEAQTLEASVREQPGILETQQGPTLEGSGLVSPLIGGRRSAPISPLIAGIDRGIASSLQGVAQLALQSLNKFGVIEDQVLDVFNKNVQAEIDAFDPIDKEFISARIGKFVGETFPALVVPGGVQGNIARRAITGGLAGAGLAAAQFTEGDNLEENVVLGGVLGAGFPVVGLAGKKLFDFAGPILGAKTASLVRKFGGDELLRSTLRRVDSAKRLGLDLTPAEATGDVALAAGQGRLGGSKAGLKGLAEFGGKRIQQENAAITKFLGDISPSGSSASERIRKTAQRILKDENQLLADAARPFYQKAYLQEIPQPDFERLLNDPVIAEAYKNVLKRPTWQRELGNAKLESIKTLDLAKRDLDGTFESLTIKGRNDEARIIQLAKEQMLNLADEVSPDYQTARAIFSVDARGVRKLESGIVGKLSRLEDNSLKNVSKVLFDPGETDIAVLSKLNRRFLKEDPEAWERIIRNEMERRLDASAKDIGGSVFFDTILRKDRDFRMFLTATRGMPGTRKALIDMRRVFKNLINPITVKTAAGQSRSSLDVPRSGPQFIINLLNELAGSRGDKAAVEIITNPKWHKELGKVLAGRGQAGKFERLTTLFGKVAAIETAQ